MCHAVIFNSALPVFVGLFFFQISEKAGHNKASVQESRFDYYNWSPEDDEVELREDELSHIVEIYDFPTEFKTEDLIRAFCAYQYAVFTTAESLRLCSDHIRVAY